MYSALFTLAQNHEIDARFNYGISNRNIEMYTPQYEEIRDIKPINDISVSTFYKYQIWKKGLFISGGMKYAKSKHYQPLVESVYGYHLMNIEVSKKRLEFHLGVNQQFRFYEGKVILDIGASIVKRLYGDEVTEYKQDFVFDEQRDWIEYKYDFTTYYSDKYHAQGIPIGFVANRSVNCELNAQVKFEIGKGAYIGIGATYSRNHVFFYDYTNEVRYYEGGSSTPTHTQTFLGLMGSEPNRKFGVRDHYVYFNSGVSYKF